MTPLEIILHGESAFKKYNDKYGRPQKGELVAVAKLSHGTTGGRSSVGFAIIIDGKKWVFTETTLELFMAAADAFRARLDYEREHIKNEA